MKRKDGILRVFQGLRKRCNSLQSCTPNPVYEDAPLPPPPLRVISRSPRSYLPQNIVRRCICAAECDEIHTREVLRLDAPSPWGPAGFRSPMEAASGCWMEGLKSAQPPRPPRCPQGRPRGTAATRQTVRKRGILNGMPRWPSLCHERGSDEYSAPECAELAYIEFFQWAEIFLLFPSCLTGRPSFSSALRDFGHLLPSTGSSRFISVDRECAWIITSWYRPKDIL